jgi:signal peptidase I
VSEAPGSPAPPSRRRRRWILISVLALVLAAPLVIWKPSRVRGNSMWPTLRGDRDWILVERSLFGTPHPERFEMWVFDAPESEGDGAPSVKRVLARGGEWVDFRAGDLFVGSDPERLERARRPAELIESMLVPIFALDEGGSRRMAQGFVLETGSWSGEHLVRLEGSDWRDTTNINPFRAVFDAGNRGRPQGVWDDHLGPQGSLEPGRHRVPDLRIDLEILALGRHSTLRLRHSTHDEEWRAIELSADGGLDIRGRHPASTRDLLAYLPDVVPPVALRIQTIDGRFAVWRLDDAGRPVAPPLLEDERDTLAVASWHPETTSWKIDSRVVLEVEVGWALLGRLDIARDVYYFWPHGLRSAYQVGAGQLFLVGDNPPASRDSRDYLAIGEGRLIGEVFRRFWPSWGVVR